MIFLGLIKIDHGQRRACRANRDPEKYLFYRVLGATRFYTGAPGDRQGVGGASPLRARFAIH
jgi:hypothetical protein